MLAQVPPAEQKTAPIPMGRCSLLAFAVGAQALAPVAVVPRIPPSQLADPYADGSARATGDWDRDAFLRGYGNCAEIEPTSIECASLPSDLRGTHAPRPLLEQGGLIPRAFPKVGV